MNKKKSSIIRIHAACLPDDIYISFQPFEANYKDSDHYAVENQSGRELLKKMAGLFLAENNLRILTQKNEKPKAFSRQKEISVSFSHTTGGVAAAMSALFNVGCDLESVERNVHSRLMDRMKNSGELEDLYRNVEPIRMWTLKESALKLIGTGLRKPMNSVQVSQINKHEFNVKFDNGNRAKICSFQYKNHWISVCYQN